MNGFGQRWPKLDHVEVWILFQVQKEVMVAEVGGGATKQSGDCLVYV